jgi:predicted nucleotidyltransferase
MPIPSNAENFSQFEKLLAGLARAGVDFAVVGGLAVALNGLVRATEDVDIIVNDASENIGKLLEYLGTWGEGWARELKVEEFIPQEGSIRVVEEFPLDIFTRMRDRTIHDFRPRLKTIEIQGEKVAYISSKDLIELKEGSWREKDRIDVEFLRELLNRP